MVSVTVGGTRKRVIGGRFDAREIARRVERARAKRDIPVKAIAQDVWPHRGDEARFDWYKKANLRGSQFTIEELGRIADILDAPPGWPFLPWEVASGGAPPARALATP
jgi:hypothetical protein